MRHFTVLALTLILPAAAFAGAIADGDFDGGLGAWQVVKQGGGQVAISTDKPALGKGCLQLSCTGTDQAWALGPALPAKVGDFLQLSFSARRGQGKAALLMTLAADAVGLAGVPVWEGVLPADNNWHKVTLLVRVPPATGGVVPRLAFGVVGPAGSWAVDAVDALPGQPPAAPPVVKPTGELDETDRLPEGWQPEGTLDARTKELVGQTELLLDVNGIEVGLQPQITCGRGLREGMLIYAVNRGDNDKSLQVRMVAPVGVEAPGWAVPIRGKSTAPDQRQWAGTTRFHMAIQCLRRGEFWAKLVVKSGADEKAAPVKLICRERYPAVGVLWRDAIAADTLKAADRANADLHVLAAPADLAALQPMAAAVEGHGQPAIAPLLQSLTAVQYQAAVARLIPALTAPFWMAAPDDFLGNSLTVLPHLVADLKQAQPDAYLISPPVALARDWQKNVLTAARPASVTAEKLAGAVSVAVLPPTQAPACVLQQTVDGNADVVNGALAGFDAQTDLGALRQLLTDRKVNRPMLVGPLQTAPGGDDRLEALQLVRTMINAVSEGATGVLLEAAAAGRNAWSLAPGAGDAPVQQAVRLLAGELAGATPLVPLADSPSVTTAPDAPVCYRPFLRGGEGIVALWNNTSVAKDVTIEFRFEPVVQHTLIFSYGGDFASRRWDPIMQFSAEAFKRGRPAIYVRLEPLQTHVYSFRLLTPHAAWLRKVELTTPLKPDTGPMIPDAEPRSWWRDMLNRGHSR